MSEQFDLIVRARRAVIEDREQPAAVGVRGESIAAIGAFDADWTATEDVTIGDDEVLIPGAVDTHVHVNEPGRTQWEGFETATRAALAGGTTTMVDMPLNSLPPTTTVANLIAKKTAAQGQCSVDVGFWGGAIPGNLADLEPLHQAGVFGFKCFLVDSGVPEFPPLSPAELTEYLQETGRLGALMIVHAEDPEALAAAPEMHGTSYADFTASRPDVVEINAIRTVIDAVRETGARAHILHLSSAQALPELRAAKAEGLPITVETCPHYLSFAAEAIRDGSTVHKCCPPIRSEENRTQLWEAVADGTIDCIVSDHSPCTVDLKLIETGDLAAAWGGVSSVQLAFRAVWTQARALGHELSDVVRWMSVRPAELVGIDHKGGIAVGKDADLVVLAPDAKTRVDAAQLEHRNKVTAYHDLTLDGVVRRTWLRGRPAIVGETPQGTLQSKGH